MYCTWEDVHLNAYPLKVYSHLHKILLLGLFSMGDFNVFKHLIIQDNKEASSSIIGLIM